VRRFPSAADVVRIRRLPDRRHRIGRAPRADV